MQTLSSNVHTNLSCWYQMMTGSNIIVLLLNSVHLNYILFCKFNVETPLFMSPLKCVMAHLNVVVLVVFVGNITQVKFHIKIERNILC